ncbi:DUF1643 domain-containing protein [Bacillus tuaregi]|uniref:DUF1643 domain-containing protein n=1 Tax=Bacillus tuaregi TaxID=1816695 RepID=UPI0008F959F6|nr:DUF1643 domain-containing protein [Bacillus tuaregi]
MVDYVYAEQLKKEFKVVSSFYNQKVKGKLFQCRNHAYVIRKGNRLNHEVNATLILMNPGTSAPARKEAFVPTLIRELPICIPYIEAKPDPTQYQVMRLMKVKGWNRVSILNLSDLCAGNTEDFKKLIQAAEACGFHFHSIFTPEREKELQSQLSTANGPILLAWGTNEILETLAEQALEKLPSDRITGIQSTNKPFYYHINPILKQKQIELLTKIQEIV